jgi:phosphatidylglycerol:prolipoprotein diacylglycerol transferase
MKSTLFSIGEMHFHSYTVMFALAFLAGTLLPVRQNFKRENPFPITTMGGVWVFFGALVGSKVYWWIQYGEWADLKWGLFLINGGLVFYGGLIGGVLAAVAYVRWCRAPLGPVADLAIPYVALAHALGRVGCFLNGCCWGAVTALPWGVVYPRTGWNAYHQQLKDGLLQKGAKHALPVHPTQLYEAAGCVVIFFLLRFIYKKNKTTGLIVALYMLFYGMLRFTTEFFRGDSAHPLPGLTASQLVALGLMVAGLGTLSWLRLQGKGRSQSPADMPASVE